MLEDLAQNRHDMTLVLFYWQKQVICPNPRMFCQESQKHAPPTLGVHCIVKWKIVWMEEEVKN